jgi:hypothetical protein
MVAEKLGVIRPERMTLFPCHSQKDKGALPPTTVRDASVRTPADSAAWVLPAGV